MRKLNIVFLGTPDFAVASLKALVDNKYNIVGVITAPDKPAGRGQKINQSAVKKYAIENNLNILQPTNLKDESFLKELKALNANLQIIVAFRMLPKQVWEMPLYGTFNLHASLLPNYRGAAPINWALINVIIGGWGTLSSFLQPIAISKVNNMTNIVVRFTF